MDSAIEHAPRQRECPLWHLRDPRSRVLQLQSGLRLAVLEGHVTLTVPVAGEPPAQVRVQAIDDRACPAPSLLTLAAAR